MTNFNPENKDAVILPWVDAIATEFMNRGYQRREAEKSAYLAVRTISMLSGGLYLYVPMPEYTNRMIQDRQSVQRYS